MKVLRIYILLIAITATNCQTESQKIVDDYMISTVYNWNEEVLINHVLDIYSNKNLYDSHKRLLKKNRLTIANASAFVFAATESSDSATRLKAAIACAYGRRSATPYLASLLNDTLPEIKEAAANSLEELWGVRKPSWGEEEWIELWHKYRSKRSILELIFQYTFILPLIISIWYLIKAVKSKKHHPYTFLSIPIGLIGTILFFIFSFKSELLFGNVVWVDETPVYFLGRGIDIYLCSYGEYVRSKFLLTFWYIFWFSLIIGLIWYRIKQRKRARNQQSDNSK